MLELAEAQGCPVEVRARTANGASAFTRWGRAGVVTLGPDLIAASDDIQRGVAAHEVAHLVRRHRQHALSFALILPLLLAAVAVAPVAAGWLTKAQAEAYILGYWIVTIAILTGSLLLWGRLIRRNEIEADDLATDWGYPVTPAIAEWMARSESPITRTRLYRPFRHHPMPAERVARQQRRALQDPEQATDQR